MNKNKYKAFNINYDIRFKVNPKYENEICEYWSKEFNTPQTLDSLFGKEDTDGYRECQTWIFMKYISPFIYIGYEPPFETTVYFKKEYLK